MTNSECPLRLTCENAGGCDRTGITFDTMDGYPVVLQGGKRIGLVEVTDMRRGVFPEPTIDGEPVFGANEVFNVWGLPLCSGAGAIDDAGNLKNPDDLSKVDALAQAVRGNTWPGGLEAAIEATPNAPWASAFQAEIDRRKRHEPYQPAHPCGTCEFAGKVPEISPANMQVTDRSTPDVACFRYVQDGHKTGEIAVALTGSNSPETAASKVADSLSQCSYREKGPLEGHRFGALGVGFGTLRACGGLHEVDKNGVLQPRPGIKIIDGPIEGPLPESE